MAFWNPGDASGGGGAPIDGPYLTNGSVPGLTGEYNIQNLSTGLNFIIQDSGTNNTVTPINLGHLTSGTAAAGLGVGILFVNESAGGSPIPAGEIDAKWTTATGGAEVSKMDFQTCNAGTNAVTMSLSGAGTLSVNQVQSLSGTLDFLVSDAATNVTTDVFTATHLTSGTAAASFGTGIMLRGEDASNQTENMCRLSSIWTTATSGSETSDFVVSLRTAGAAVAEKVRVTSAGLLTFGGATSSQVALKGGALDNGTNPGLIVQLADNSTGSSIQAVNFVGTAINGLFASSVWKMLMYSATNTFAIASNQGLVWDSTTNAAAASPDIGLYRDGAGVLSQRLSTQAQNYDVYGTYTSSTSYERLRVGYSGTVYLVQTQKGSGGGTARALSLGSDSGVGLKIPTDNTCVITTPNAAPNDANLSNSSISIYLDQGGNVLKIRVRYSDGTLKDLTTPLALT